MNRIQGLIREPREFGRSVMTENGMVSGPQYRTPQSRVARNRPAERREYPAMKPLPLPGRDSPRDNVPGHTSINGLIMTQDSLLFHQHRREW